MALSLLYSRHRLPTAAHHGNFPEKFAGQKSGNWENWENGPGGRNKGPQRPQRHPYGSVPKIRHIPPRFGTDPVHDNPRQAPSEFPKTKKRASNSFRQKSDISETLPTSPGASGGCAKVDTDRSGNFDQIRMPKTPSQATFNFSKILVFGCQLPWPGPGRSPTQKFPWWAGYAFSI